MLMSYSSVSPDLVPPGPGLSTLKSQFMETEAWHSFIQVSLSWWIFQFDKYLPRRASMTPMTARAQATLPTRSTLEATPEVSLTPAFLTRPRTASGLSTFTARRCGGSWAGAWWPRWTWGTRPTCGSGGGCRASMTPSRVSGSTSPPCPTRSGSARWTPSSSLSGRRRRETSWRLENNYLLFPDT